MPFPTDPQERKKIFALIGIGSVALIYGLSVGVIKPMKKAKTATHSNQAKFTDEIDKANKFIRAHKAKQAETASSMHTMARFLLEDDVMLIPELDNYQLVATAKLRKWCDTVDIPAENINISKGNKSTLRPSDGLPSLMGTYKMHITMQCGLPQTILLFREIEMNNPLCTVSGLAVQGRDDDVEAHSVTYNISWPIWTDLEKADELKSSLRSYLNIPEAGEKTDV